MSGKKASWAKVFGRLFTSGALLGSLLTMGWETARPALAVDSCTSGSMRTYSVTGRTFRFGYERDFGEIFDDQKAHQFTVVEFSSDGVNDALCSWTAPKGIKGSQLAVVGGGGAGGLPISAVAVADAEAAMASLLSEEANTKKTANKKRPGKGSKK